MRSTPWLNSVSFIGTRFTLTSGAAAGSIQINLSGATNASYILQASTDLATWTSIATNAPFNTTVNFSDTDTALPCKFYRVTQ
jgi:hypothetical protein